MKAVVIDAYGGNEVVRLADIEQPSPGPGEVLVRVEAAGVNPVDWKIRNGAGARMGKTLPIHLGGEIAGKVESIGDGVENFRVGDDVFGIIDAGGFAEYALARAADLAHKPATLDFVQSAAIPLGALTAWQALFDVAHLMPGQSLLITNGSGGVGSLAVQIAKATGAHVIAMASAANEAYVRSLGADAFIDHTAQRFEDVAGDVDVVFDTVGGEIYERAFAVLKPEGFLATAVAFPSDADRQKGPGVARVQCQPNGPQLASIRDLAEAGKIRARVAQVLPLANVADALDLSENGRPRGKIVLHMAS
ncbi:NADP-dependent oxidoreductase [Aureimonas sp. ME7]|uniref:NADP-dependent oxidoreductase n=1 Tax=Aureimonas sp. ME7 TaxID=2744252 RepID=UPI0015F70BD0|nr:NADP-dependent oxidoreductase [Aureimonas sp. ME7]